MHRKAAAATGWASSRAVPLATVREISERDVPRVLALYSASVTAEDIPGSAPAIEDQRAEWLRQMVHRGFNFVAEEEGRLVAHLALIRVGDTAQVSAFVHPEFRRRGIGSTLLRVAVDQARDMGLRHILIAVPGDNRSLQEMLLQSGFTTSSSSEGQTNMVLAL